MRDNLALYERMNEEVNQNILKLIHQSIFVHANIYNDL